MNNSVAQAAPGVSINSSGRITASVICQIILCVSVTTTVCSFFLFMISCSIEHIRSK